MQDNEKIARALEVLRPFAIAYARLEYYGGVSSSNNLLLEEETAAGETYHQLHARASEFGHAEDDLLRAEHLRLAAEAYTAINGTPAHAE